MAELAHLGPQVAMVLHYLHEQPLSLYKVNPRLHIVVYGRLIKYTRILVSINNGKEQDLLDFSVV